MAANPPAEAPPPETLKYQTLVFKVLIHCDGCTKRVKKILQGIDGVYTAEIDSQQHKVTVTGNVEAETIIKKLSRSGKSVELWPVQKPAAAEKKKDKKSGKSKGEKTEDNIVKNEKENQPLSEDCIDGDDNDGGEDSVSDKEGQGNNNECEGGACGNTGGENSKKKKKKKKKNQGGQNGNSVSAPPNNEEGKEISSKNAPEKMGPLNSKEIISPPVQHAYPPPPPYPIPNMYYSPPQIPHPPPPQAPYGLSYNINTSYPISNPSYYVGPPIMPMHAYTNSYSQFPPPPPPPSDLINGRDHDDEYEGGGGYCSIM